MICSSLQMITSSMVHIMTFFPWYLSTNVESNQLKPEKVHDPAADQDHCCYTSSFETALEYFHSHGVPRKPKGQKRFLCKNRLGSAIGYKLYKSTHRDRRFNNIEEALMHVHNQPVGADLLGCEEMWRASMKKGIYKGPQHQNSPICCYHAVNIVVVERRDGEWVAVCKLSNSNNIGCDGFLYVSLKVRYMLILTKGEKAAYVRQYEKDPQFFCRISSVPIWEHTKHMYLR